MKESKLVDYISLLLKVCLSAQLILFVLKLCGIFKGEWWIVFLPTYVMVGIMVLLFIVFMIIYALINAYMKKHGYSKGDYKSLLRDIRKEKEKDGEDI